MHEFPELQADLHALHEAIDTEQPLEQIRIAALRALTRHRFFTEEILKATGDWEPRLQQAERDRRHERAVKDHQEEIRRIVKESGIKALGQYLQTLVPPLLKDVSERAKQPIGQFLKHSVHRIASTLVRDRDEEAATHWEGQKRAYEDDLDNQNRAKEVLEGMDPERRERLLKKMEKIMRDRTERAEPGDDWVGMDEVVADDDAFETNRKRVLREDAQELELYLIIFERRLQLGSAYSGLDLINEQETIAWPQQEPDWEQPEDPERETLIRKLEEITGKSFR
jgi:hypothetical protein